MSLKVEIEFPRYRIAPAYGFTLRPDIRKFLETTFGTQGDCWNFSIVSGAKGLMGRFYFRTSSDAMLFKLSCP